MFLISDAYAQGGTFAGVDFMPFVPIIAIGFIFYFLIIRPQQKKSKQHHEMVSALRRGDKVVTSGGIIGSVSKVINDEEIQIEIAEGVKIRLIKSTISQVLGRTAPVGKSESSNKKKVKKLKK